MKKSVKAMRKHTLNFAINAIMTLCMSAIIGTGFLIKYTLISGQERWKIYGENTELYFLGLARHQWGMIHLVLGFVLFGLLIVHIVLHRKIVTNVYHKIIKIPILKKVVALSFIIICLLLILLPLIVKPRITTIEKGKGRQVTLVTNVNKALTYFCRIN
jgi:hypothetical protein